MSFFLPTSPTKTIRDESWPPGLTVTIKTSLSGYEQAAIDSARRRAVTDDSGVTVLGVVATPHEHTLAILEHGIASWTAREGRSIVPVTRESFKRLSAEAQQFIAQAILTECGLLPTQQAPGEEAPEDEDATFSADATPPA